MYDYFSLDVVCARETPVPITFAAPAFGLGRVLKTRAADGVTDSRASELFEAELNDGNHNGVVDGQPPTSLTSQGGAASSSAMNHSLASTADGVHRQGGYTPSSSSESADVAAGAAATVPLWAAEALRVGGFAATHVPAVYRRDSFRDFRTDAHAPSLFRRSPYFYEVGLTLCALLGNPPPPPPPSLSSSSSAFSSATSRWSLQGRELAAQLFRLFQVRYMGVIRAAAKKGFDLADARERFTVWERHLLDGILEGKMQEAVWRRGII